MRLTPPVRGAISRSSASEILVGVRRAGLGIESELDLRIDHRDQLVYPPVAASYAIVVVVVTPGWIGLELSGQHALIEPPVVGAQHGPASAVSFAVTPSRGENTFHV